MAKKEEINTRLSVYDINGKSVDTIQLDKKLFDGKVNKTLLYEVNKMYEANSRKGAASTKSRSEVSGGGAKPWRQKGTGRARVGTRRTPIWVGGGVTFGPCRTDYNFKVNKKVKRKALNAAISKRVSDGRFIVINKGKLKEPSTKAVVKALKSIGIYGNKVLILDDGSEKNFYLSCRNISGLQIMPAKHVNPYQVLTNDWLVVVKEAVGTLLEVFK